MAHPLPTPLPEIASDISRDPCLDNIDDALAVLQALGPDGIAGLRRPMGVLVYRLGKLLCAETAPTQPIAALLDRDLERSLLLYPDLKWQEAGLRSALGVLVRVLDSLGRYVADAPDVQGDAHTQDTFGRPLPFLPLFQALATFAMAFPVRPDSRRYEPQPGEESVLHAGGDDKPKVRQDAHRSFATLLDACDYQAGWWNAPFKSEQAFAASGMPYIGTPSPRPARKGDCHWRKPKGSLSPDIVVVPPEQPASHPGHASKVAHAVELKLTADSLGLNQSQNHIDMVGRDRFHLLYAPDLQQQAPLSADQLARWIAALRTDANATAAVAPQHAAGLFQTPATWGLAMSASAFFPLRTKADVGRLATLLPQLHDEFQMLTGHALTRYMGFRSGAIARKGHAQEDIEAQFLKHADDIASLQGFDAPTKESSSRFEFQAVAQFRRARTPRAAAGLDCLALHFPLDFWTLRHNEVRAWWLGALQRLQPVQAYMGLGLGRPPVLERYPLQQAAEFALAKRFLGLDIDKPFFMRSSRPDGMSLECGLRTPGFGVLVCGEFAARLGGASALQRKLEKVPGMRLEPCMEGGLWIEAGEAPALYPAEEGVPRHLRALAEALIPVRLDRLWMTSYAPNAAGDEMFTPASSALWLQRFDSASRWPRGSAAPRPTRRP
jgi:hypothetical protein